MVMGLLLKLMMTKQLKFEDGLIAIKNINLNLLPSFFISELMTYAIDKKDKQEMSRLYFLSWYWGFDLVKKVDEAFGLKKPEEIYEFGMSLGEAMGIGLYKTHDYYPGKYTHFIIDNNPFLKYMKFDKNQSEPVDYFIAGTMAGGGCMVHNAVCQNVELSCQAMGAKSCEFITGTEKELKQRKLWDIAVERYNLDILYPLQKKIFNGYHSKGDRDVLMDEVMETLAISQSDSK